MRNLNKLFLTLILLFSWFSPLEAGDAPLALALKAGSMPSDMSVREPIGIDFPYSPRVELRIRDVGDKISKWISVLISSYDNVLPDNVHIIEESCGQTVLDSNNVDKTKVSVFQYEDEEMAKTVYFTAYRTTVDSFPAKGIYFIIIRKGRSSTMNRFSISDDDLPEFPENPIKIDIKANNGYPQVIWSRNYVSPSFNSANHKIKLYANIDRILASGWISVVENEYEDADLSTRAITELSLENVRESLPLEPGYFEFQLKFSEQRKQGNISLRKSMEYIRPFVID